MLESHAAHHLYSSNINTMCLSPAGRDNLSALLKATLGTACQKFASELSHSPNGLYLETPVLVEKAGQIRVALCAGRPSVGVNEKHRIGARKLREQSCSESINNVDRLDTLILPKRVFNSSFSADCAT